MTIVDDFADPAYTRGKDAKTGGEGFGENHRLAFRVTRWSDKEISGGVEVRKRVARLSSVEGTRASACSR